MNILPLHLPLPSRYWDQDTVNLADDLLPIILFEKSEAEIAIILDNPINQPLVDILRSFCNQTYKIQININRGLNVCCYNVVWENVGNIVLVDPRNMSNLNYLMFSNEAYKKSKFIFAVLYVVKVNLKGYLQQTLNAQGFEYCSNNENIILDKIC